MLPATAQNLRKNGDLYDLMDPEQGILCAGTIAGRVSPAPERLIPQTQSVQAVRNRGNCRQEVE